MEKELPKEKKKLDDNDLVLYSEAVNSIENAKEFCDKNKIEPFAVVILFWGGADSKGQ